MQKIILEIIKPLWRCSERIFLKFSPIFQGFGENISPTSGKGCGAFLKSGYPLALLAKLVNGETERFASKGFLKCVHINCVEEPFRKKSQLTVFIVLNIII